MLKGRAFPFLFLALVGGLVPYLLMSRCSNGFAILAGDELLCDLPQGILYILAEQLWSWFVISSMAIFIPIVVFWVVIFFLGKMIQSELLKLLQRSKE